MNPCRPRVSLIAAERRVLAQVIAEISLADYRQPAQIVQRLDAVRAQARSLPPLSVKFNVPPRACELCAEQFLLDLGDRRTAGALDWFQSLHRLGGSVQAIAHGKGALQSNI